MVLSEFPQPTDRSGLNVSQSELHGSSGTTTSSDNENHPMTPVSPGRGSLDCAPLSTGYTSTDSNHDATYKEHQASSHPLPSLQIRTDFHNPPQLSPHREAETFVHHSISSNSLPHRTPSLRGLMAGPSHSGGSLSPASILASPQLMAMGDITPLPSPIGGALPWGLTARRDSQSLSRTSSILSRTGSSLSLRPSDPSQISGVSESRSHPKTHAITDKPSGDQYLGTPTAPKHTRNRSLSEYVPQGRGVPLKPRPIVVSGTGAPQGITSSSSTDSKSNNLHREQYLAVHRGIALPAVRPPSPPRSSGYGANDNDSVIIHPSDAQGVEELYSVRSIRTQQPRLYRKLRQLGQGAFSQVSLAVRVETEESGESENSPQDAVPAAQKLVAIKVIDHGPAGGADEERLEVSLKREVEILKSLNHPSLVQLKAFGSDEKCALLVLDYCPGGDLFEVVSHNTRPMSPGLIRRIFAELVAAVRYLHEHYVVHRDIKLENVLVNIPSDSLQKNIDWRTYDRAVVTLSDLGLSRRIPEPPESPLLQTRCGSEDYAAPEILMGQQYDGRSTDGWALGVLLYAMMESRLPFDALPGTRGDPAKLRARTPHRIARCEWSWYRYADSDGEWDAEKGRDLEGARECVESLLKRNTKRKGLDKIASLEWVRDAIDVPCGLKRGDKEVP
ncbi:kinase-like domain-containing protein [Aspergillus granulosus]|uniref:Kinase-like domain-containing protein n=1 Tax=Aspergillus granulosus TaxID=176169 RepID=A0ABR4HCT9_9EURO